MLSLFTSLQFSNLFAFAALAALPLLVLAYLRRQTRKARTVGSLRLYRQLSKKRVVRKRFRPPPRFFLELLALLLLVTAAAMPVSRDESTHVALVIDSSLSMRAKNPTLAKYPDRFSEAKQAATEWIEKQGTHTRFSVFTSSPKLQLHGAEGLYAAAAKNIVEDLIASRASDSLEVSIDELAESGDFEKVQLFSDRRAEFQIEKEPLDVKTPQYSTVVEVQTVGEPVRNVFISDIHLSAKQDRVVVAIGASSNEPTDATLSLYVEDKESNQPQLLSSREVRAELGRVVEVSLPFSQSNSEPRIFRVELTSRASNSEYNSISEDDVAWISEGTSGDSLLLLVSPEEGKDGLGLRRIPGFRVVQVKPREYNVLNEKELAQFSLLVFHRSAPSRTPLVASLLILPPTDNSLFPVSAEIDSPRITSWANDHPVTTYLRVPLLRPGVSALFEVPLWAQSIINTEEGSLIAGGEGRGLRFAASGLELLPFEGAKTPSTSILLLNLLSWLTGGQELSNGLQSGSAIRLDGTSKWVIRTPTQETAVLEAGTEQSEFFVAEHPGVYSLSKVQDSSKDRAIQQVVVNSLFPEESASYQLASLVVPSSVPHAARQRRSEEPLWEYLLLGILLLLILEYLWFCYRGGVGGQDA